MEYLLIIPGTLNNLNDYIAAERTNRHKGAKMKADNGNIQDALVDTGVLKDDGWKYVVGFSDRFQVDKEHPRIEVKIREVEA